MIKIRVFGSSATIAVALFISMISLAPAQADPTPAPTISADPYKAAMDQFKHDRDIYMAAMRDREIKMRDINLIFKNAVDKANLDARGALATATTPLQKSTIAATRRNAIDAAINARDTAIAALGDMPVAPTEPMRQPKQMGLNNPQGKQKR
jgi:hypothetical protein